MAIEHAPWVTATPATSLAVSAGAGSGKTTSLVGRVAALLAEPGFTPSQLVVITFTEKAARDVAHRLRATLGPSVALDDAYIGTIHGFCQSLLRRYPIEAGLPPKFTTADELTNGVVADERAAHLVQQYYELAATDPANAETLNMLAAFNALRQLPSLVLAIDNQWAQFEHVTAQPYSVEALRLEITRRLAQVPDDPEYAKAQAKSKQLAQEVTAELVNVLPRLDSIMGIATACYDLLTLRATGKSKAIVPVQAVLRFGAYVPAIRQLIHSLVPLVVDAARERVARGELSFDDLLVLTRRLLITKPAVRAAVRARHRALFVDEFQDTDRIQFDIVTEITRDDESLPASLFAVGDPKQSIYGFRNADVELFQAVLAGDPHGHQLTINRRSRADVCTWINAALDRRFIGGGADHQVHYSPLEPARDVAPDGDGPAVVVLGMVDGVPVDHQSADDVSRAEAADIAATIQRAVDPAQPWLVGRSPRAATYGDITVLVRSRTRIGVLEHTLRQAGVPYRVEGGTLIYGSREAYELLRVLRAVDDPTNQLKVVAALRTSVFGLSDVELAAYRLLEGSTAGRKRNWHVFTDVEGPVGDALRTINALAQRKHERSAAELLAELYDTTRGAATALFEGPQAARETWRRVRYVIDEARAFSDATGGTLGEYLAWVDRRIDDVDRVELSTDEGEDSVRIMTVHAAKGLEFPIAMVASLGGMDSTDSSTGVRWHHDQPLIRIGKVTSEGLHELGPLTKERDQAEEARLLYVAFTRAEDHLVVSVHHKAKGSAAGRLVACFDEQVSALANFPTPGSPQLHPPTHERSSLLLDVDRPEPDELDRSTGQVRRVWTPSAIAKLLGDAAGPTSDVVLEQGSLFTDTGDVDPRAHVDEVFYETFDDEGIDTTPGARFGASVAAALPDATDDEATDPGNRKEPRPNDHATRRGGRYGTAKGSAVHAVMQQVDLHDPFAGLGKLVSVAAEAEGVSDRLTDVERMVRSLLSGPLFARMQASPRCRREMYVGAHRDGISVWGYVDAVFVNPDGTLTLVDFKTDTLVTSPSELERRYRPQMSAYVLALQQATGRDVSQAWLAVAQPDGSPATEIAVDVMSPDEVMAALPTGTSDLANVADG